MKTKKAKNLKVGEFVLERDGCMFEITEVRKFGDKVTVTFNNYWGYEGTNRTIIQTVRANAKIRFSEKTWNN